MSPEAETATESSPLSTRLDNDHFPETNGWMTVCRRCGFRTTGGIDERHSPLENQEARITRWLDGQERARRVAKAKGTLNT